MSETLAERIVRIAESRVGLCEILGNGRPNDGQVVRDSCEWLVGDPAEFRRLYESGKLMWCVGFARTALRDAGSRQVHRLKTLRCSRLIEKAAAAEARCTGEKRARLVQVWAPGATPALPGDLLLTDADRNGEPGHVVIVTVGGATLGTVGGNSGPKADRVARVSYAATDPRLFKIIRVLG